MSRRVLHSLRILLVGSLAGVIGMGLWLRLWLAGLVESPLGFAELRSAHSHLAFYGLIFPGAWLAWLGRGVHVPGPRTLAVYTVAVLASTLAFAHSGYNLVSIVGSTVVLGVWLRWATPLFRLFGERSWAGVAAPVVLAASLAIPVVAVLTRRGDPMAVEVVRAFLTWLLLGVAAPAALHRVQAPAPPAWASSLVVLGAGLALGPAPSLYTNTLLAVAGVGVVRAAALSVAPRAVQAGWFVMGVGLVGLGVGVLPEDYAVTLAGLHFAALGPVFTTLLRPADSWLTGWAYLTTLGGFAAAISAPALIGGGFWPLVSALAGAAVVGFWLADALRPDRTGRERDLPSPLNSSPDEAFSCEP